MAVRLCPRRAFAFPGPAVCLRRVSLKRLSHAPQRQKKLAVDYALPEEDDDDEGGGGLATAAKRKAARGGRPRHGGEATLGLEGPPPDPPGSLGAKLEDLGRWAGPGGLRKLDGLGGGGGGGWSPGWRR